MDRRRIMLLAALAGLVALSNARPPHVGTAESNRLDYSHPKAEKKARVTRHTDETTASPYTETTAADGGGNGPQVQVLQDLLDGGDNQRFRRAALNAILGADDSIRSLLDAALRHRRELPAAEPAAEPAATEPAAAEAATAAAAAAAAAAAGAGKADSSSSSSEEAAGRARRDLASPRAARRRAASGESGEEQAEEEPELEPLMELELEQEQELELERGEPEPEPEPEQEAEEDQQEQQEEQRP